MSNTVVIDSLGDLYQKFQGDLGTISREGYNNIFDFVKATEFSIKEGCNCSIYRAQSEQFFKSFGGILSAEERLYFLRLFSADQILVYWEGNLLYKIT